MSNIRWIIFGAAAVVLLVGLVVWQRITNPPIDVSAVDGTAILAASAQSGNIADHVTGKTDSKVRLIEYGDFQCPGCKAAEPYVEQLMTEYGDRISLVFRNFPLTTIHPNAKAAAAAAEAAGLQGKYWEMHNLLYSTQNDWNTLDNSRRTGKFEELATSVGVNLDTYRKDYGSSAIADKIAFDQALGKKQAIDATPTFFLNGTKLDDDTANALLNGDLTKLKQKIDDLLKA